VDNSKNIKPLEWPSRSFLLIRYSRVAHTLHSGRWLLQSASRRLSHILHSIYSLLILTHQILLPRSWF